MKIAIRLWATLLLCCLSCLFPLGARAADGLIAFRGDAGSGKRGIYTVAADGSQLTLLLPDTASISYDTPDWSPDGQKLVVVASNSTDSSKQLYVLDKDGTHLKAVTPTTLKASEPSWSPDGTQIAFEGTDGNSVNRNKDIYLIKTDGTNLKLLFQGGNTPDWSPDGTHLVYTQFSPFYDSFVDLTYYFPIFFSYDIANDKHTYLSNDDFGEVLTVEDPAWSPDGTQIAGYMTVVMHPFDVLTDDLGLGLLSPDTQNDFYYDVRVPGGHRPAWKPDGTQLVTAEDGHLLITPQPQKDESGSYIYDYTGSAYITGSNISASAPSWSVGSAAQINSQIQFASATYSVDEGVGSATITVARTGDTSRATAVKVGVINGGTTSGNDYKLADTMVTFLSGQTSSSFKVTIVDDYEREVTETLLLQLGPPEFAELGEEDIATISIVDNDASTVAVSVSVDSNRDYVTEGASAQMDFAVTLSYTSTTPITVNYTTVNGTAKANSDYIPLSGTLTFAPNTLTKIISIPIIDDDISEDAEDFYLKLSSPQTTSPTKVVLQTAIAKVNIFNDDDCFVSVDNPTVTEGNSGVTYLNYNVALSHPRDKTVSVQYHTENILEGQGIAASAGKDYVPLKSATLTLPAGTTSKTVTVKVVGDVLNEPSEKLMLVLNKPNRATFNYEDEYNNQYAIAGIGTILDDDPTPTLSIDDVKVVEGKGGRTTDAIFTVKLTGGSGQTVTVKYITSSSGTTALAPADYKALSGSLTFASGQTSKTIKVTVSNDLLDEVDETYNVLLYGASNAAVSDNKGVGTIIDDDTSVINVDSPSINEGNSSTIPLKFTLKLSTPNSRAVSVKVQTVNAPSPVASANVDYIPLASQTITFAAGETTKTISVSLKGDTIVEPDEHVGLFLASPVNATLAANTAVGTILNDDTDTATSTVFSLDEEIARIRQAEKEMNLKPMIPVIPTEPAAQLVRKPRPSGATS